MKLYHIGAALILLVGCSSHKNETQQSEQPQLVAAPSQAVASSVPMALPKAIVYKMSGDYAQNIPVQLGADGQIVSYPAPSDVAGQQPLQLADGWWLDRRGISLNSVFTRYTYAEYQKLSVVPSLSELKAAIIPGARVTEVRVLQMSPAEAAADTAAVNRLLAD